MMSPRQQNAIKEIGVAEGRFLLREKGCRRLRGWVVTDGFREGEVVSARTARALEDAGLLETYSSRALEPYDLYFDNSERRQALRLTRAGSDLAIILWGSR